MVWKRSGVSYSLIYADPPWTFKVWGKSPESSVKTPSAHYQTLSVSEICSFPVGEWSAKDSNLVMWVYDPMLPSALKVAEAWGFTFVTVLFRWLKSVNGQKSLFEHGEKLCFGTGYHTRGGGCEEAFLFKKGKGLPVKNHSVRKEFYANRREHSRKPDEVRVWLTDLYGDVPRLEMFARTKVNGWDVFGNETGKFKKTG